MDVNKLIAAAEHGAALAKAEPAAQPEVAEYQDEELPEVRGAWMPQTLQDVDWALRRKAECEAEAAEIGAQLYQAIEAAKRRAAKLMARAEVGARFFDAKIAEWVSYHPEQIRVGKKKSRDFLHGRIQLRQAGGRLKVVDKKALEDWLLTHPVEAGLYRFKVEVEMRALQEHFKATGEVPPGAEYDAERDELYVTASLPGEALAKEE